MSRTRTWISALVGLAVAACALLVLHPPSSMHAVYRSPSGAYKLTVYSYYRFFAMPGDSTGGAGYVELSDLSGRRLARAKIPLVLDVSSASDIHWYDDSVSVPGAFEFPLPHP